MLLEAIEKIVPRAMEIPQEFEVYRAFVVPCWVRVQEPKKHIAKVTLVEIFIGCKEDSYGESRRRQLNSERHPSWPAIHYSVCSHKLLSDKSLSFIRDQLNLCERNHTLCRATSDSGLVLPSRLLDLGHQEQQSHASFLKSPIRLMTSLKGIGNEPYVCLSHRWSASGDNITTERSNLEEHQRGIHFDHLDLSIRKQFF